MKPGTMYGKKHPFLHHSILMIWIICAGYSLAAQAQIQFQENTGHFRPTESWGISWGDYNGDGWTDLFLNNHRVRSSIYRNNGDGSFDDVVLSVDQSGTWTCDASLESCPAGDLGDTHGGGWADFDNDGDQDIIVYTGGRHDAQFFINDGGVFFNQTEAYGLTNDREGQTPLWWDYDNDGLLDLAIQARTQTWLMRQNTGGDGFTDTTGVTGLHITSPITTAGQLLDINNDNILDYLGVPDGDFPSGIYDPTTLPFTDLTDSVSSLGLVLDSALGDYDGDLKTDILLSRGNLRPIQAAAVTSTRVEAWIATGKEVIKGFSFDNYGTLAMTLYTQVGLIRTHIGASGYSPVRDGDDTNDVKNFTLDPENPANHGMYPYDPASSTDAGIYIGYDPYTLKWTVHISPADSSMRGYFVADSDLPVSSVELIGETIGDHPVQPIMLLASDNYLQSAPGNGLNFPMSCVSAASGDFDNDMDIDIYMVCRGGIENLPNRLFANQGDGTFVEVAAAGGAAGPVGLGLESGFGQGENVAVSDYDIDGYLDLFVTNGLHLQPIRMNSPNQLFRNTTVNANHWIELDLIGTTSNRDGIGATITATAGGVQQFRQVDGGYHRWSQNDKRVHIGLGANTQVDLVVKWPSGIIDTYTGVSADSLYKVTEGATELQLFVPGSVAQFATPAAGDECGMAPFQPQIDNALFLWKDCSTGQWHVRAMAGGSSNIYEGSISGEQALFIDDLYSIEGVDSVVNNGASHIDYYLKMSSPGEDGFSFSFAPTASTCFNMDSPLDRPVLLGSAAVPVQLPLNLSDLTTCPGKLITAGKLSIDSISVNENEDVASFTVSLLKLSKTSKKAEIDIFFDYTTSNINAIAGLDYISQRVTGQVIPAGKRSVTIDIPIVQDNEIEGDESFRVTLSNVVNASLLDAEGIAVIQDDASLYQDKLPRSNSENINLEAIQQLVLRFYQLVLQRNPEVEGYLYWTEQLFTGNQSAGEVAINFFFSNEFINKNHDDSRFIEIAYQTILNRTAEPSGKDYWLNQLASGLTRLQLIQGFIGSQEFQILAASYGILI